MGSSRTEIPALLQKCHPHNSDAQDPVDVYVVATQEHNFVPWAGYASRTRRFLADSLDWFPWFKTDVREATARPNDRGYRGWKTCFPMHTFDHVGMVEPEGFFEGLSLRQFRLFIFKRKSSRYVVKIDGTTCVNTRKVAGVVTLKGAVLASVCILEKSGAVVTRFIASSLHIPNGGAGKSDDNRVAAQRASQKVIAEQSVAYDMILDAASELVKRLYLPARSVPMFVCGDQNPRTIRVPVGCSDKQFFDGLQNGSLIFRAKLVTKGNISYNDQVADDKAMYNMKTLSKDLKENTRNCDYYAALIRHGDSLRYHKYRMENELGWRLKEMPIHFLPTYKWKTDGSGFKDGASIPAHTDRIFIAGNEDAIQKWDLTYYGDIQQNGSDHKPVELLVRYKTEPEKGSAVETKPRVFSGARLMQMAQASDSSPSLEDKVVKSDWRRRRNQDIPQDRAYRPVSKPRERLRHPTMPVEYYPESRREYGGYGRSVRPAYHESSRRMDRDQRDHTFEYDSRHLREHSGQRHHDKQPFRSHYRSDEDDRSHKSFPGLWNHPRNNMRQWGGK